MRALVVALVLAAAATAAADDAGDAAARKARAAKLVDEASAAQQRADYATAIDRLREAYDLIPHPDLLYNLGQAYRLAGQPWDAIDQYERYLAVEPKGRFAGKARGFVAALKKETAGKSRPEPDVVVPPPAPPIAIAPVPPPVEDATAPALQLPPPPPREQPPSHRLRPLAIGVGIAGAAGLGAGIYFGVRARSISDELSSHQGAWTDPLLAKQADGEKFETRAIWLSAAGGALLLGGVVLFAIDARSSGGAREVAVTPVVDGGAVGVVVHGAL